MLHDAQREESKRENFSEREKERIERMSYGNIPWCQQGLTILFVCIKSYERSLRLDYSWCSILHFFFLPINFFSLCFFDKSRFFVISIFILIKVVHELNRSIYRELILFEIETTFLRIIFIDDTNLFYDVNLYIYGVNVI